MNTTTSSIQSIVVRSTVKAGGAELQHAEGVVVRTAVTAGGRSYQHAEGIVVSSAIRAGGGASGNQGNGSRG